MRQDARDFGILLAFSGNYGISKSDHRPPERVPSPPAYRPVRHKRQKSKETEFEFSEEVDYRWVE